MANSKGKHRKNQRKASASQNSDYNKALARQANKKLGTKFKTRGPLSKYAVQKIKRYEESGLLSIRIEDGKVAAPRLVALKTPRNIGKAAQAKGFDVIETPSGPRIVVANREASVKRFKKAIAEGHIPGVTRIGASGIETIILPWKIKDMAALVQALENDELDAMKEPDEHFAFRYFGRNSHRPFIDSADLREYLTKYKSIFDAAGSIRNEELAEEFENFELLRIDTDSYRWSPSPKMRRNTRTVQDRRERVSRTMGRAKANADKRIALTSSERMAKSRANETEARRAKRLADQKARSARNRKSKKRT